MTTEKDNPTGKRYEKSEEPKSAYGGHRIVFFDSFEEMNHYDIRRYANMSPEERLRSVYHMRAAFHPETNIKYPFGRRVHFIKSSN